MLKNLRSKHPLLYAICAEISFFVGMAVPYVLAGLVFIVLRPAGAVQKGDYLVFTGTSFFDLLGELGGLGAMLFFLWRTDRLELMKNKGSGFLKALFVGGTLFLFDIFIVVYDVLNPPEGAQILSAVHIVFFILATLAVGLAEETTNRAVIGETLLEHFGTNRAGVWKACIISSFLFGAGHLVNMFGSDPMGVLSQCCFAFCLGMLQIAIYFRTGNIWACALLHGLKDIGALWGAGGVYAVQTEAELFSSYTLSSFTSSLPYLAVAIFLLRGSKLHEVEENFGKYCKK